MIYITSDWHFNHKNIIKHERIKYNSIVEHNEAILNVLENKLTKNDILYCLGDIGYPDETIAHRLRNLKCKEKYLILGNHDKRTIKYYKDTFKFTEVYNHPIYLNRKIVLSHIPIPVLDSVINVHGHLHGSYLDKRNYVNASWYVADCSLIKFSKIEKLLSKLPGDNNNFLEEWFGKYYVATPEIAETREDILLSQDNHILGWRKPGLTSVERFNITKNNIIGHYAVTEYNQRYPILDMIGYDLIVQESPLKNRKIDIEEVKFIDCSRI